MKEHIRKVSLYKRSGGILFFLQNNTDMLSFKLKQPLYHEILKFTSNKKHGVCKKCSLRLQIFSLDTKMVILADITNEITNR